MNTATDPRNISEAHCQSCGSTSPEDVQNLSDTEGYTRCCNERVISHYTNGYGRQTTCDPSECSHE